MPQIVIEGTQDLYRWLLETDGRLVANIPFPWSPGHMTHDVDNFLRMLHLGDIDRNRPYLLIFPEAEIPVTLGRVFREVFSPHNNIQWLTNNHMYIMMRELCHIMPELTVDAGLSHSKFALIDRSNCRLALFSGGMHYVVNNKMVLDSVMAWYRRRARSVNYQPLANVPEIDDPALLSFLGGNADKLALIHLRCDTANAGIAQNPETFFPTLEMLRDTGHTIVFVGREAYAEEFARFGVLNYAQSPVTSFRNDLLLFKAAKVAIVSGAGIASVAEMVGTPLVFASSWYLYMMFASRTGVWVPAMLRSKRNGRLLKFSEQLDLILNRPEPWELPGTPLSGVFGNPWTFGPGLEHLEPRAPEADELLDATLEALELSKCWLPPTELQLDFINALPKATLRYTEGRISRSFIRKFAGAIEPGFE